jgi:carboxymethylenebutenolidase
MPRIDVQVPTSDGVSTATLHVPDGEGPWPGVLLFTDIFGRRPVMDEFGDRLAGLGYVALIPDLYYREGGFAPFDTLTAFGDEAERNRLFALAGTLTNERIIADAGSYADFLLARPEVRGSAIGTQGYCMGGRLALVAAGVPHTVETWPGGHGFTVSDMPSVYDAALEQRHWDALRDLYAGALA